MQKTPVTSESKKMPRARKYMFVPNSIGFRLHLYGPDVTSLLVGVMGAGVPFPFIHSSKRAQVIRVNAMHKDTTMMLSSTTLGNESGMNPLR